MNKKFTSHKAVLAAICLTAGSTAISTSVSASGGGGGGFSSGGGPSLNRAPSSAPTRSNQDESTPGGLSFRDRIDQQYELGKAYYKAPLANGAKLEYCVQTSDGLKKLSRKSVKMFKRGSQSNFVDNLFSCVDPSLRIADAIPEGREDAIFYYLNKRFKLGLTNS